MSSTLSWNGNNTGSQAERQMPHWMPYHELLGFDPFPALRSSGAYEYDVTRTENGYEVEVPVPGYKPENIEVTVKDGLMTVSGNSERRNFSRSFSIPEDVDQDLIEAKVNEGMLVLNLQRRPEAQPKRIQIK